MFDLKVNKNNLKNNEELWFDSCLNELSSLLTNEKNLNLVKCIHKLFYNRKIENFVRQISIANRLYDNQAEIIAEISKCFDSWGELMFNNDLGNYRGVFTELLLYKSLNLHYSHEDIFHEVKFVSNEFVSYTPDFVVKKDNLYKVFECKASSYYLNRDVLCNLIDIHKNIKSAQINILVFDFESKTKIILDELKHDESRDFINSINKFNIIYLDDFVNGNHLKSEFL